MPGAAFVNPGHAAPPGADPRGGAPVRRAGGGNGDRPLGRVIDEKAIVNAMVGLLATGGSTNHAIHLPAIARAAGILIDWEDFDQLSTAVPLIARIYPNGVGGREPLPACRRHGVRDPHLLDEGLLHGDTVTAGADLGA